MKTHSLHHPSRGPFLVKEKTFFYVFWITKFKIFCIAVPSRLTMEVLRSRRFKLNKSFWLNKRHEY